MWETRVWSLAWEDPLEKEMVIHSSILAWRIPWTEKPGRLQSMGSQRVGHDWVTSPSPSYWQKKKNSNSNSYSTSSSLSYPSLRPNIHIWASDLLQRIHWGRPATQPLCQFIILFFLFQWKRSLLKVKDISLDSASILSFYIQIFDIQFKRHCYELNIFKEEYRTTITIKQMNRGGTVT